MPTLFRKILVPHDFSDHATDALKVAGELARVHRGRLLVLHAVAPFYGGVGFPPQEEVAWLPTDDVVDELRQRLRRLVARAVRQRADCRVVVGDPVTSIVAAARSADSIVMATMGRTGLSHLLIGSVAERVVRLIVIFSWVFAPAS